MKAHQKPMTNMQALIQAVHATRPPVLAAIKIDTPPHGIEVIHMEFALTPELIKAWGEQCAEMLERKGPSTVHLRANPSGCAGLR